MMKEQSTDFKIKISITKIKLKVRFSCMVSCVLKVEGKEYEITGEVELKNGQVSMNWSHSQNITFSGSKDSLYPSEKKLALLIYLKSSSGKIPAGTVALPLTNSSTINKRQLSRIDKCPDKNAFIEYDFFLQSLQSGQQKSNFSVAEKVLFVSKSERYILPRSRAQREDSSRIIHNEHQFHHSPSRLNKKSLIEPSLGGKETVPLRRLGSKNESISQKNIRSDYYFMEKDKDNDHERMFTLQREVESSKTKLSIIQSELNSKAIKVVELEREGKQNARKIEGLQIQLRTSGSKVDVLEKTNKDLSGQIKKLKQKMEEDEMNFQNAVKRVEIREQSGKQQIRSLTEKLYAVENIKQKMLFDKNISTNEFQQREKKTREGFKVKQKKNLEEKAVFLKKIDNLQKQLERSSQQFKDIKAKNTQSLQNIHEFKLMVQTLETENDRYRLQISDLRYETTRLRNEKKIIEQNLQTRDKYNDEKRNYRKQLNQRQLQYKQMKQKLVQVQGNYNRIKASSEQMESNLKEKNNRIKLIEKDYNCLSKENKTLNTQLENNQSKLNSIIQDLQYEMKKSSVFETKCRQLQCQFEQQRQNSSAKIDEYSSRVINLEQEIQRLNTQLCSYSQTIKSLQQQVQTMEQQLQDKSEHIENLQSNLIQLNEASQTYQYEKIELSQQSKNIQDELYRKLQQAGEEIKVLTNKVQMLEYQHQQQVDKIQKECIKKQSSLREYDGMVKQKQQIMVKTNAKIIKLEKDLQRANKTIVQNQQEKMICQKNFDTLKSKNKELIRKIQDSEVVQGSLRTQNAKMQFEISTMSSKIQEICSDLKQKTKQFNNVKDSYQIFRSMSVQALNTLCSESKVTKSEVIIEHFDEQFCTNINSLLRKITLNNQIQNNKLKESTEALVEYQEHTRQLEQKVDRLQLTKRKIQESKQALQSIVEQVLVDKETHVSESKKNFQLLKKNQISQTQKLNMKKTFIEQIKSELIKKQQQMKQAQLQYEKQLSTLNRNLCLKNRQLKQAQLKMTEIEVQNDSLGMRVSQLVAKLSKVQKQKKELQNQSKRKISQLQSLMREQVEKVDNLQIEKSTVERELKTEKDNVKKAFRQLQSKCLQKEELQTKQEEVQQLIQIKQIQTKKTKEASDQLKLLLDAITNSFSCLGGKVGEGNSKLDSILMRLGKKENNHIFQKVKNFSEELNELKGEKLRQEEEIQELHFKIEELSNQLGVAKRQIEKNRYQKLKLTGDETRQKDDELVILTQQNMRFASKLEVLEDQIKSKEKERVTLKRDLQTMKQRYNSEIKLKQKELEVKYQLLKFIDDQKYVIETLKKSSQDILRSINNLEKDKKISLFAMVNTKQFLKKMDDLMIQKMANQKQFYLKFKKEWDQAAFRLRRKLSAQQSFKQI